VRLLLSPEALGALGPGDAEAEEGVEAVRRSLDTDFPLGFDTGSKRIDEKTLNKQYISLCS
jgi:hypothetical protein